MSVDRYEIIAGERRWRASSMAGLNEIPVMVHDVDNETVMVMALVENLQREDLNAIDKARAMQRLLEEFALTHQQVANILGKSRAAVTNSIRLLQLTDEVQRLLEYGDIDMDHARCLLGLDAPTQNDIAKQVVARQLSVRQTEALVSKLKSSSARLDKANTRTVVQDSGIQHSLAQLAERFSTEVSVKEYRSGKSVLQLHCDDEQALTKLLERLSS